MWIKFLLLLSVFSSMYVFAEYENKPSEKGAVQAMLTCEDRDAWGDAVVRHNGINYFFSLNDNNVEQVHNRKNMYATLLAAFLSGRNDVVFYSNTQVATMSYCGIPVSLRATGLSVGNFDG